MLAVFTLKKFIYSTQFLPQQVAAYSSLFWNQKKTAEQRLVLGREISRNPRDVNKTAISAGEGGR